MNFLSSRAIIPSRLCGPHRLARSVQTSPALSSRVKPNAFATTTAIREEVAAKFGELTDELESTIPFPQDTEPSIPVTDLRGAGQAKTEIKPYVLNSFYKPMDLERANRIVKPRPRTKVSPRGPSARVSAEQDPFRQLGIDPLREVNNPVLLNHFVSDMGKIQGRGKTGLTWWSQRKMGKAIRRARNMGIIPILSRYRHPYSR